MAYLDGITELATILTAWREDMQNDNNNDVVESHDIFDPIKEYDDYHDWISTRDEETFSYQTQHQNSINGGK